MSKVQEVQAKLRAAMSAKNASNLRRQLWAELAKARVDEAAVAAANMKTCDTVNLFTLTPIRPVCPECGVGTIELVLDGQVGEQYVPGGFAVIGRELPTRWRSAPFGACNACEFCIEIDPSELSAGTIGRVA